MILSRSAGDPLLSNSSTLALLSNQAVLDVQTTSKSPCTRNPSRPVAAAPRTLPRIPLPMWLTDHAAAVFDKPLPSPLRALERALERTRPPTHTLPHKQHTAALFTGGAGASVLRGCVPPPF